MLDLNPDILAERNIGRRAYSGNQIDFYWFAQDDWKLQPNSDAQFRAALGVQRHPRRRQAAGTQLDFHGSGPDRLPCPASAEEEFRSAHRHRLFAGHQWREPSSAPASGWPTTPTSITSALCPSRRNCQIPSGWTPREPSRTSWPTAASADRAAGGVCTGEQALRSHLHLHLRPAPALLDCNGTSALNASSHNDYTVKCATWEPAECGCSPRASSTGSRS